MLFARCRTSSRAGSGVRAAAEGGAAARALTRCFLREMGFQISPPGAGGAPAGRGAAAGGPQRVQRRELGRWWSGVAAQLIGEVGGGNSSMK